MGLLDFAAGLAPPILSGMIAAAVVEAWERWRYR
jgi:hypothetical protein